MSRRWTSFGILIGAACGGDRGVVVVAEMYGGGIDDDVVAELDGSSIEACLLCSSRIRRLASIRSTSSRSSCRCLSLSLSISAAKWVLEEDDEEDEGKACSNSCREGYEQAAALALVESGPA